jgi:hypothetical protein
MDSARPLVVRTKIVLLFVVSALLTAAPRLRAQGASGGEEQPRNPSLAAATYAVAGINAARTGVFPYRVSPGTFQVDLRRGARIRQGPINVMTFASPSPRFMWAVSSRRVAYLELKLAEFTEVAGLEIGAANPPGAVEDVLKEPFTDLPKLDQAVRRAWGADPRTWPSPSEGARCALVDSNNVLYVDSGRGGGTLLAVALVGQELKIVRSLDLSRILAQLTRIPGERLVALNMTYDGRLIVVGSRSVAVIERSLAGQPQAIALGEDETVSQGVAVDAKGGIYVASDRMMRKLVWTGYRLTADEADGAWKAPYDVGLRPPAGKTGSGTGSAPALMGFGSDPDKLVVIADGADRMKLVAFWRNEIPKRFRQRPRARTLRVAGQIEVTCGLTPPPTFLQSRHAVVVRGYGAFVVNSVRSQGADHPLLDAMAAGPIFDPAIGAERFEWVPEYDQWRSVWTRPDAVSCGMTPALSAGSATVLVEGYSKKDGWELTGMDWNTGRTVHRTLFGQDPLGNGAFGAVQFIGDDDLLFDSLGGPIRTPILPPEKK